MRGFWRFTALITHTTATASSSHGRQPDHQGERFREVMMAVATAARSKCQQGAPSH
ncbi:hypothetical protein KCP70_13510 [Salmonella enterica subsp. enterica]|nr:hypothetical protein KCP70_13510 [Salmonella enterica subsp. enterica]